MYKSVAPSEPVEYAYAYAIPSAIGWSVYDRFYHLRAVLLISAGYTSEMVDTVVRLIDGEVVL